MFAELEAGRPDPDIFVIPAEGGAVRRLAHPRFDDEEPAWSPDGTRIAYWSWGPWKRGDPYDLTGSPDIYVMNKDGSGRLRLTQTADYDYSPAWSPGKKIAFIRQYPPFDGVTINYEIVLISADGPGLRRLTENVFYDGDPAWSPDGKQIAFVSERREGEEIWVMEADGSGKRMLRRAAGLLELGGPSWTHKVTE